MGEIYRGASKPKVHWVSSGGYAFKMGVYTRGFMVKQWGRDYTACSKVYTLGKYHCRFHHHSHGWSVPPQEIQRQDWVWC